MTSLLAFIGAAGWLAFAWAMVRLRRLMRAKYGPWGSGLL